MPVLASAERVVKCPTGHCPGWLTVRDDRPQTAPCRYCRVTVNTLTFVLDNTPGQEGTAALPPAVHEAINDLLLATAGRTGGNVYIRPMERSIVGLVPSVRGLIVEYNPIIARYAGPEAAVALMLHHLLHIELHPRDEKPFSLGLRAGMRDREALQPAANALLSLTDHAWIAARIDEIDSRLTRAKQDWALDVAEMLTGGESVFPPYMADRDRRWLMSQFDQTDSTAEAVSAALRARLAALSARFFTHQREDLRRALIAVQFADLGLRDPGQVAPYAEALHATSLPDVEAGAETGAQLAAELQQARAAHPHYTPAAYKAALEAGLRTLGFQSAFEVRNG
jgi:hypothetical protein